MSNTLGGRRLTISDLKSKRFIDLTQAADKPPPAPKPAPRSSQPPPPKAPAKPAKAKPQPPAAPATPTTPGRKIRTAAQIARRHRQQAKRRANGPPLVEVLAVLTRLGEAYPRVFGACVMPLQIGCREQIEAETGIETTLLRAALKRWCERPEYIEAIRSGTHRHSLDGEPIAELSEQDRTNARAMMPRR